MQDGKKLPGGEIKSNKKRKRTGRGVETMLRIASKNNQHLSDMADKKANILITVNAIVLSIFISLLLQTAAENSELLLPTYMIMLTSVLTIAFSILATRPRSLKKSNSLNDVDDKKVNLLFFENYHWMKLEKYLRAMFLLMEDGDYLYQTLIRDLHSQGVVLQRKYRLLRIAYGIFIIGLVISWAGYGIASYQKVLY